MGVYPSKQVQTLHLEINGREDTRLNILSAPLGAFLLSILPMQAILGIDVTTTLLAITTPLFIQIPQPYHTSAGRTTFWQDFASGFATSLLGAALLSCTTRRIQSFPAAY
jgi:hypothetical protein